MITAANCNGRERYTQVISPLRKKDDNLVEVGKLVEYAVYLHVVEHFTFKEMFYPNHHGFLTHHFTATALIQLVDMMIEAAE